MSKEIDIQELVQYLDNKLTEERRLEIEAILRCNPYYQKMLHGLIILREELDGKESLDDFLERKKELLKKRIFKQ